MGYDREEGPAPGLTRGASETCCEHLVGKGGTLHTDSHAHAHAPVHTQRCTVTLFLCPSEIKYGVGLGLQRLLGGWLGRLLCGGQRRKEAVLLAGIGAESLTVVFRSSPPLLQAGNQTFHSELVTVASTQERVLQIAPDWHWSS